MSEITEVQVKVVRLHGDDLPLPSYQSSLAAGLDVHAAVDEPVRLAPLARAAIPTGLAFQIPAGFELQVRPRSGLALKHGITVANAPGTIDADYRGEVKVLLVNLSAQDFEIRRGDRVAQLVLARVAHASLVPAMRLDDTDRGDGGFGSTGKH